MNRKDRDRGVEMRLTERTRKLIPETRFRSVQAVRTLLWPHCVADEDIIFLSCFFFFFIPRLISAVAEWMSTIGLLRHMMWS